MSAQPDRVDAATGKIRLRCTIAELEKLDPADVTVPLHGYDADLDNSDDQVQRRGTGWLADPPSVTYDTLPAGEAGVRGGEHVHAADGDIGQIQGIVIDSGSHQVTHVLLQEGHVFGRKVVAIPIGAVTEPARTASSSASPGSRSRTCRPAGIDHPGEQWAPPRGPRSLR